MSDDFIPDFYDERTINGHQVLTYARCKVSEDWMTLVVNFSPSGGVQLTGLPGTKMRPGEYPIELIACGIEGDRAKRTFKGVLTVNNDGTMEGTLDGNHVSE